jgi:nucleoside phosphorylase
MSKIIIHQAFYGEVNRAHSQIHQTVDDSELTSFLIRFTDRPGSVTPGVTLKPYISGTAFKKSYVFTKTFPDPQASRSGMVLTHVLITARAFLKDLNDLKSILNLFISEIPIERTNLEPIVLIIEHAEQPIEERQPTYIQKSLSSFIKGDLPILFTGDLDSFESILEKLWNSPINSFREQLKFRASFSPKDIENSDDLTIVFIQRELLSKWNSNSLISGDENDLIEITSPTEALFLGKQIENPFYEFLKNIGANLDYLKTYTQGDILYTDYIDLDILNDSDLLRRDLRILAKLSPKNSLGNTIKEKFIGRYSVLINSGLDFNVKGLRNIPWDSFNHGIENGENLVNTIIDNAFRDSQFKHIEMLSEVSSIAINEKDKTWWHNTIVNTFKLNISKTEDVIQNSIWKLLLFSKDCSNIILSIIPSRKVSEATLIQYLPKEVPTEIGQSILLEAQKRKWYLLHAVILLKLFKPEEAIKKQLTFEHPLSLEDSIGMSLILKEITDNGFLAIALNSCNEKLILELAKRIIKNESLLKTLDLQVSCWLNIWTAVLNEKQVFHYGIKGKEQSIVFSVFDLSLQGKKVNDIVFEQISNTTYSNISDYKSRNEIWVNIPTSSRDKFIDATADSILKRLIKDEIDSTSIEQIIAKHITSNSFMSSFLSKNRNNMEPVLKVFESFSNLPDHFLSNYLYNYQSKITEEHSIRLGNLVIINKHRLSAKEIYKKSKYNDSFKPAYSYCESLVEIKESSFLSNLFGKTTNLEMKNTSSSIMNILIVTATDKETSAVLNKAEQMLDQTAEASIQGDHAVSFLGTIKSSKIWHAQCEAGSGGPSGSQAIVTDLIVALNPKYVLMPGIAFGLDVSKQKIGDILISTHVCPYEKQRVGQKETIQRGEKVPSSPSLLSTLRVVKQKWKKADMHFGIIMSGEKLVDNPDLVAQLKEIQPEAIGGEMEGAGLYAAAYRKKTDWILFKSIVDWGMGKTDEFQNDSSLFASEVLFETLKIIVV